MNRLWELEEYLARYEHLYPAILRWNRSILNDLPGKRSIFGVLLDERLVGLSVAKHGRNAKLCHISLDNRLQHLGLGLKLASVTVDSMLTAGARRVHVTTGEEVSALHGGFFRRLGFAPLAHSRGVYHAGHFETIWKASIGSLVHGVHNRMDGASRRRLETQAPQVASWLDGRWEPLTSACALTTTNRCTEATKSEYLMYSASQSVPLQAGG